MLPGTVPSGPVLSCHLCPLPPHSAVVLAKGPSRGAAAQSMEPSGKGEMGVSEVEVPENPGPLFWSARQDWPNLGGVREVCLRLCFSSTLPLRLLRVSVWWLLIPGNFRQQN